MVSAEGHGGQRAAEARLAIKRGKPAHIYDIDNPVAAMCGRWKGSMCKLGFAKPVWLMWVLVHTVGRIVIHFVYLDENDESGDEKDSALRIAHPEAEIPWQIVGMLSTLMTFSLVFFGGQCYKRFFDQYRATTDLMGALQTSSIQLTVLLTPEVAWDALRLETAAAILLLSKAASGGQTQLSGTLEEEDWHRLQMEESKWLGLPVMAKTYDGAKEVRCPPLLSAKEVRTLKGMPTDLHSLQCQAWALRVFKADKTLQGPVLTSVHGSIFKMRNAVAAITNAMAMPVPLPYYNAVCWTLNLTFAMYSYCFLFFNSWFTPLYLFLLIAIINGLREVGSAMADPFGDNDIDLHVELYIHKLRITSAVIVGQAMIDTAPDGAEVTPAPPGQLGLSVAPTKAMPPAKPEWSLGDVGAALPSSAAATKTVPKTPAAAIEAAAQVSASTVDKI